MPITNLAIQRKRLIELSDFKRKFSKDIKEVRISRFDNYQYFYIIASNFQPYHIDYLKQMEYDLHKIEAENEEGIKILVGKWASEKHNFPEGILGYICWSEYVK